MKKLVSLLVGIMVITSSVFAFSDLDESHWAYKNIMEMKDKGYIAGFSDGTFQPDKLVTREQASTIFTNVFNLKLRQIVENFSDVEEERWSKYYIDIASQYIDGLYDEFFPEDAILRVEVANAVVKLLNLNNESTDLSFATKFNDWASFSEDDQKVVAIACENGIMNGKIGRFDGYIGLTRAELCTVVMNVLNNKELLARNNDKVVMKVNGEDIKFSEFNNYMKMKTKYYEDYFGDNKIWNASNSEGTIYNQIKDLTKDEIVETTVKVQKAKEVSTKIPDDYAKQLEEYLNLEETKELAKYYDIDLAYVSRMTSNNVLAELSKPLIYNTIDHSAHTHLDISKPIDKTTYSARHILFLTQGLTEDAKNGKKALAESVLARIKKGENFGKLATEYTEDLGSKETAGLYENIEVGNFVKEFEDAALSLKNGKVYPELVESSYGYHIIKLESKKTEKVELGQEIKNEIIDEDYSNELKNWLRDVKIEMNEEVYKLI